LACCLAIDRMCRRVSHYVKFLSDIFEWGDAICAPANRRNEYSHKLANRRPFSRFGGHGGIGSIKASARGPWCGGVAAAKQGGWPLLPRHPSPDPRHKRHTATRMIRARTHKIAIGECPALAHFAELITPAEASRAHEGRRNTQRIGPALTAEPTF
jgi:hypothetical protein